MTINEDDLREMMNEDGDENKSRCPLDKTSIPSFMLEVLKVKSDALSESLKLMSDLYKIVDEDSRKKEVFTVLKDLMTETKNTIDQMDYLVAMVEDGEDDEDEKEGL